ncbi:hypothetical protein NDU88_006499 [Pleurodeles waltl]|uniref:Uncharacterized protein n=1 Tax=Pleurodeles waltl TaxID=8319 RepID=A0AAV7WXS8_PLEWA|nr:hypothetical protein NDU88_006499 [Pleurodeles waltl]
MEPELLSTVSAIPQLKLLQQSPQGRCISNCTVSHDPPLIDLSDTWATVSLTEPVACEEYTNTTQPSNTNTTQGGNEYSENPAAILKQCITSSSSSLAEMEAHPSSNPRRSSALVKQDQATGTVSGCLEEAKAQADPSLEAKLKEDRSVSGETGASRQALISTMDAMSAAI